MNDLAFAITYDGETVSPEAGEVVITNSADLDKQAGNQSRRRFTADLENMTAYDQVFYPIFGVGCVIATIASIFAARKSGLVFSAVPLGVGIIAFWAGLFIGSEVGYQTWQSIPDPPDEAFSDTAPLGALLFGWLPGSIFCGVVFGITRLTRQLFSRGDASGGDPDASGGDPDSIAVETGNPYQSPGSRHGG